MFFVKIARGEGGILIHTLLNAATRQNRYEYPLAFYAKMNNEFLRSGFHDGFTLTVFAFPPQWGKYSNIVKNGK